jgi:hypothetical protein
VASRPNEKQVSDESNANLYCAASWENRNPPLIAGISRDISYVKDPVQAPSD